MKRLAIYCCLLIVINGCELPPRDPTAAANIFTNTAKRDTSFAHEEYVMVTTAVNMPMYVRLDQAAFIRWGKERKVKIAILGPAKWDVNAQINLLEELIGTRPTGLLVNGTDPALAPVINKAVAAGIPTVVYDSNIPGGLHQAFIGSNWYEMGRQQGEAMAALIKGKGKIAYMGILGLANMEAGFRGLLDVLKKFPDIEIVGKYDDKASVEEAAGITANILSAHPDIAGICGFDSNSGPGIALSVKEAGKAGLVKITTVDWEPEHLRLLKEGTIQLLVGQKRELFTWYGAQCLYDLAHGNLSLSKNDAAAGIVSIPREINTGTFLITPKNINAFLP